MSFERIKKNFGFGAMRLKMNGDAVDYDEFCRMIDAFMEAGFNYFDTAHGYIDGKSETAIRDCLSARYPRETFVLANKLSHWCFKEESDILPLFESQLALTGVEYFDFYLLHAVGRENYEKYKKCNAFGILRKLKAEGKIRHIAMSFHDTADVLDAILSEQSDIEVVQLQINYLDMDDPSVQSKACYEVAVKHGKKVIVMEPVKGGTLAKLPREAAEVLDALGTASYASYALRYVAGLPEVMMVLSGMGSMEMMLDNIATMSNLTPITEGEMDALERVREIIRRVNQIGCTACDYCLNVCPKQIHISQMFGAYNERVSARLSEEDARALLPTEGGTIDDCIGCGRCEGVCPQGIDIREKLKLVKRRLL